MQKTLYFDCFSGISGDMAVAAMLGAGIDVQAFGEQLTALNLSGYDYRISQTRVNELAATDFDVIVDETYEHPHRHLKTIIGIIEESGLDESVKSRALGIFQCVAEAEATVHSQPIEAVHFHEVGAVDSIVDIVAASICIDMLEVDRVVCSPLPLGRGTTNCAHGTLPVPAPATAEILSDVPVYQGPVESELVTPTGAAIVKNLVHAFGGLPPMKIISSAYGAGKKRFDHHPNLLRAVLGTEWEE